MQGHRAGIVSRILADAIDLGVLLIALLAGYLAVSAVRFVVSPARFSFPRPATAIVGLIATAALIAGLTAGWTTTGRTPGKRLLGLRVVDRRGRRLRALLAFVRAVVSVVLPIELLWSAISARNESVADLLVGSSVIYDWKLRTPALAERRGPASADLDPSG